MSYSVSLPHFEGPLDLLLHLIRRDKINVYDIPISHITREYLAYIEIMKNLKLEIAGEFFVMAATLMRIKSHMLLPHSHVDEDEEDPRSELVYNLLEYKKFKEAADRLSVRENSRRKLFTRPEPDPPDIEVEDESLNIDLFDLLDAYREILDSLKGEVTYKINRRIFTIDEKMKHIRENIKQKSELLFTELFKDRVSKQEIVVTFMAILELIRTGEIIARQMFTGGNIILFKPEDSGYLQAKEIRDQWGHE
jgi:segregation and condensation protein A